MAILLPSIQRIAPINVNPINYLVNNWCMNDPTVDLLRWVREVFFEAVKRLLYPVPRHRRYPNE
jgi:hypothetical protein